MALAVSAKPARLRRYFFALYAAACCTNRCAVSQPDVPNPRESLSVSLREEKVVDRVKGGSNASEFRQRVHNTSGSGEGWRRIQDGGHRPSKGNSTAHDPCDGIDTCTKCIATSGNASFDGNITDEERYVCSWSSGLCSRVVKDKQTPGATCDPPHDTDPCKSAGSCPDCLQASSDLSSDEICFWINKACEKRPKNDQLATCDACPLATSCEECIGTSSNVSGDEICSWRNETCWKVPSNSGHSESAKCESHPPTDPCRSATSCQECQKASSNATGQEIEICSWSAGGTCTKIRKGDNASVADMCLSNPCLSATSCDKCRESYNVSSDGDICLWKDDTCTKMARKDHSPATICPSLPIDPGSAGVQGGIEEEDGDVGSPAMLFMVILILCFAYYLLRKRRATLGHYGEPSVPTRYHKSAVYEVM
jgi:hypothetical protein